MNVWTFVSPQTRGIWSIEEPEVEMPTHDAREPRCFISLGNAAMLSDFKTQVVSWATEGAASDPIVVSQCSVSAALNSSQTREKTSNTKASISCKLGGGSEDVSAMRHR
jgi:hypothetical protein